jgi:penicillin-binding protein 2
VAELKNLEGELDRFRLRLLAAGAFVLLCFGLLTARLSYLQVVRYEDLAAQAETNRTAVLPIVPNRGQIVDRNGVVLATNYSAYTLEITPSKVDDLDATIDELSTLMDIGNRDRRRFKRLAEEGKSFESLPIRTKLSDEEVARFMAQRYRFPGVDVNARLFRHYPLGDTGSHLLGYIGRINQAEKKLMDDWPEEQLANYKGTEYIGKLGLEQSYESELHGLTGFERVETSAGGRAVRRLDSHAPTPGNTLVLSIDIRLQALVEDMFGDRRGALVVIDPRNGEVLAFVSKPTFDPNLFVDGIDADSWRELNESIDKPLLNRALRGTYPPGSTFKPFMAMAALNSGKRAPNTVIQDGGNFAFGNHVFRSHGDKGLGPVDMYRSIVKSSNVYYYSLAAEMGVDLMHEQLEPFGFGRKTDIDVAGESSGLLPSTEWKRNYYKRPEQKKWYAGETISLGIGQGYNSFTALQLASATATLVSGGQRFKPRLVSEIVDAVTHDRTRVANDALKPLAFKTEHTELILRALHGVTQEGTSVRSFSGAPYKSGGKTGTAQAVGIKANQKYNASKLEEHKRDHSLYIAAAPLPSPTIALAVVVENSGFGSEAAAPMARRVIDYLLLGLYPSEEDLVLTRKGQSGAPVGTPRRAVDVPLPGQAVASSAPPASSVAARVQQGNVAAVVAAPQPILATVVSAEVSAKVSTIAATSRATTGVVAVRGAPP